MSKSWTFLGLLILVAVTFKAVMPQHAEPPRAPNSTAKLAAEFTAAPSTPELSRSDRDRIIKEATRDLLLIRDKFEKISFYRIRNQNFLKTRLEAYISVPDSSHPLLRISPVYYGDDWVFADQIKVIADDEIVYSRTLGRDDVSRSNSHGVVWETADFAGSDIDISALRTIAGAKSATIRFSGRERQHDHELTKNEFKNLKTILRAFDALAPL